MRKRFTFKLKFKSANEPLIVITTVTSASINDAIIAALNKTNTVSKGYTFYSMEVIDDFEQRAMEI